MWNIITRTMHVLCMWKQRRPDSPHTYRHRKTWWSGVLNCRAEERWLNLILVTGGVWPVEFCFYTKPERGQTRGSSSDEPFACKITSSLASGLGWFCNLPTPTELCGTKATIGMLCQNVCQQLCNACSMSISIHRVIHANAIHVNGQCQKCHSWQWFPIYQLPVTVWSWLFHLSTV